MDQIDFAKGALIGGCLGGLMAILVAPKSGKALRNDIREGYHSLHDQVNEYADEIKGRAQNFVDSVHGHEEDPHENAFILGGLTGAVVGAVAALLLAPQSGAKLRQHLGDEYDDICDKAQCVMDDIQQKGHDYHDKLEDWKDTFLTLINKLSTSKKKGVHSHGLDDIVDWASLGLRLYNQVKARR